MPKPLREWFDIPWRATDEAQFRALAMATRKGFHVVPGRLNHWTLRSTLRYVGAQTREQRYQPAA